MNRKGGGLREPAGSSLGRLLAGRPAALFVSVLVTFLTLALGSRWDIQSGQEYRAAQERRALEMMGFWRGRLEAELNTRLHLVHGVAGLVHADPEVDEATFQRFAAKIAGDISAIRSLQLAPGGVVRLVWPLATNRAAIGHDLLADPSRRAAATAAMRARGIWIAGPMRLIQGGVAIIGRRPIFLPSPGAPDGEAFWGFATILIDLPEMMASIGMPREAEDTRFALRGVDALGARGEVFFGDRSVFLKDGLRVRVNLPEGSWELAALPVKGWSTNWPRQRLYRLLLLLTACGIGVLLFRLLRSPAYLRRSVDEAVALRARGEQRFSDAIEALQEGFAIFDAEERLIMCNEQFRELYDLCRDVLQPGRTFSEIVRRGLERGQFAMVRNPSPEQMENYLQGRLALHRQPNVQFEEQLSSGRWLQVLSRPMQDGGTVTFHIDITDVKQKERELVEARRRAETANATKSAFLATVSHEVRTPLNSVIGLLGLLCETPDLPARERERAATAHDSARHLLQILNEILDISKMEAGRFELEHGPFCPAGSAREVLQLVDGLARQKNLETRLTLEGEGLAGAYVMGDEGRFRQVLLNLVSNAVKFTDSGRVDVYLRSKGLRDGKRHLELMVMDTGIGFDEKGAARLFQPFSQLDSDARRQYGGTGLGLAISHRLVTMMGGEIRAEGRKGIGAVFTVRLELEVAQGPEETEGTGAGARDSRTPLERGWRNIRVLLVEDSPTNQMVFQAMLEGTGYRVDVASSGEEALQVLDKLPYDLVMMDVFMPGMDGLETTRALRGLPDCADLPVIALTANAMQGDRERFIAAGMDDYLPKPIDKQELLHLMAHWAAQALEREERTAVN